MRNETSPNKNDLLLDDLTDPQRQAVTHTEGPLLVLAAAGSGKTRVITRRIAHLILRVGIPPWNILAITFTNKAAGEMRTRVGQLVSERQANAVSVCTFHSLCSRLLRQYADRLDLPRGYTIYDAADQNRAMKNTLKALQISTSNFPPGKVLQTISNAKNELIGAQAYAATAGDFYSRTVAQIYTKYQKTLAQNRALDFDDLLLKTVSLMREHPDVLAELRQRFAYLLIDEYQDTNHAQFVLANALSSEHHNICATGDPDQAIYGWRGANIRNILEFEEHYPDVTTVRLEQNYRSTKHILAAASELIQKNTQRKHKLLWTENEQGEPVRVITCQDEQDESQWVVDWFRGLRDKQDIPWGDMAVFYRANSLSRVIEDALRNAAIPYQIARGTAFYERKEIKDAVAYLRVIANPADEINLARIINTPARGISTATVRALGAYGTAHGVGLYDVMKNVAQVSSLNPRAIKAVNQFTTKLNAWRYAIDPATGVSDDITPILTPNGLTSLDEISLRGFVEQVLRESGLETHHRNDKSDPDQERLMNLGELVSSAQQYEETFDNEYDLDTPPSLAQKLEAYLEQISLVTAIDNLDDEHGAVTLMTLHAAKGLEFPAVAMIGLEDGLLPHSQSENDQQKLEEERRLCFVGITRAQRTLALTHTNYRTIFGQVQPTIPSRFLGELGEDNVKIEDVSDLANESGNFRGGGFQRATLYPHVKQSVSRSKNQDDGPQSEFPPGALVRHPQFGLGRVIEIRQGGTQARARVEFNTAGVKTLVLQYARLERVTS